MFINIVFVALLVWCVIKFIDFYTNNTVNVHGKTISLKHYQNIKHGTIEYIRAKQKGRKCDISTYLSDDDTWLLSDLMLYERMFLEDLEKETGIDAKEIIRLLRP